jgi:hexosaminidase
VGRTPNELGNLRSAARHGAAHGARGMLITDWGDRGHLQPQPISAPGWIAGAALAWNAEAEAHCDAARVATWLDEWWFEDRAAVLGTATVQLGRLQELTGDACKNGSAAFFLVAFGERDLDGEHFQGLTIEGIERGSEHLTRVLLPLERVSSARADSSLVVEELALARDFTSLGLDLGRARLEAGGVRLANLSGDRRAAFAERVRELARRHRDLWPRRQRPGGLEHSASWLEALLPILGPRRDHASPAD